MQILQEQRDAKNPAMFCRSFREAVGPKGHDRQAGQDGQAGQNRQGLQEGQDEQEGIYQ
ncbi:unnamed protein product [Nesidiocoris tenuis]|uniref:Uncharacterized protein n=1 Tax=Nesidiocoris tenuis TaxID=355587 RepID=A0A6H5GRX4_9HEMI|nr:unnamed protein product [Nesidiocoris tenuis]